MPLVYDELHRLAHKHIRRERPGHTLQTSALVNEAYLRLVDQRQVRWENRWHFFGIVARSKTGSCSSRRTKNDSEVSDEKH